MDKNRVKALCNQIQAEANGVYIRGCDDVARNNLARLMAICNLATQIVGEISKPDKEPEKKDVMADGE